MDGVAQVAGFLPQNSWAARIYGGENHVKSALKKLTF
jgi:hypothetical protein